MGQSLKVVSFLFMSSCPRLFGQILQPFGVIENVSFQSTMANFMVCLGKSLNFLLFCLSSSSFRNKFIQLTKNRINQAKNKP